MVKFLVVMPDCIKDFISFPFNVSPLGVHSDLQSSFNQDSLAGGHIFADGDSDPEGTDTEVHDNVHFLLTYNF